MNLFARSLAAAALAGACALAAAPAAAQPVSIEQLAAGERAALRALYEASQQRNWSAFAAALPGARSAVQSGPGRYVLGQLQLQMGLQTQNMEAQAAGIDLMLASGVAPAPELRTLLLQRATMALREQRPDRAEELVARAVELDPADPRTLAELAEIKLRLVHDNQYGGNAARREQRRDEGLALYHRAVAAAESAGRVMPESFYRRAAALGLEARNAPLALGASRALVVHYPSPVNWRDSLLQLRDLYAGDAELALDAGRLMVRADALAGERDHLEFAEALLAAGRAAEAKALLDRGVASGMLAASEAKARDLIQRATRAATAERSGLAARQTRARAAATGAEARQVADTLLGLEQFAEAAEFYRLALEKGGEDPNLVNSRLGLALAFAGQRAEAEAALRSVAGPRQALSAFALAWLARRPA